MNKDSKILVIKPRPKFIRYFFIILELLVFLLIIVFLINNYIFAPSRLEVDYLDVGQGDSELIQTPDHKLVLIDGGPDNLVIYRLGKILPFYKKEIDYVILSHFHDDHIAGLAEVFKRYKVKNFIYLDSYQSLMLNNLLEIAKTKKTKVIILNNAAQLNLGQDCLINLLNPNIFKIKADQNNSIITKLECAKNSFLFSGDNSSVVEYALLNSNFNLPANVLKASHHGSKTANGESFLRTVAPRNYIISSGLNNKFNHPSPEILERAKALNLNIFRTDQQGTIKIFGQYR